MPIVMGEAGLSAVTWFTGKPIPPRRPRAEARIPRVLRRSNTLTN